MHNYSRTQRRAVTRLEPDPEDKRIYSTAGQDMDRADLRVI